MRIQIRGDISFKWVIIDKDQIGPWWVKGAVQCELSIIATTDNWHTNSGCIDLVVRD